MFTLTKDSRIVVWDVAVGGQILTLSGHNGGVTGIQLNGSIAASASYDGTIRLWNVVEGTCINVFSEADNFVRCVGFIGNTEKATYLIRILILRTFVTYFN